MAEVRLEQATISDIPLIAALAEKIWHQHYPAIIGEEQVDYMLKLMYSHGSLKEQMNEKKHRFYIISQNGNAVGFVSWHRENQAGAYFINKFYIDQELASKGIGTAAFTEVLGITSAKMIRLTVNRQNFKAINFYFKCGFRIAEVADFDIGGGFVMNDFVMEFNRV